MVYFCQRVGLYLDFWAVTIDLCVRKIFDTILQTEKKSLNREDNLLCFNFHEVLIFRESLLMTHSDLI
jgi:hypothetical protein